MWLPPQHAKVGVVLENDIHVSFIRYDYDMSYKL